MNKPQNELGDSSKMGEQKNRMDAISVLNSGMEKDMDPDSFFQNKEGEIEFCAQCLECKKNCKQSFRVTNLICRSFSPKPKKAE